MRLVASHVGRCLYDVRRPCMRIRRAKRATLPAREPRRCSAYLVIVVLSEAQLLDVFGSGVAGPIPSVVLEALAR
jgi:hypothetical protein